MNFKILLFFLANVVVFCCSAQTRTFYIFTDRYSNNTIETFADKPNITFRDIKILTQGNIINSYSGSIIDFQKIGKRLDFLFPNRFDSGVIVIDLENDIFKDLRDYGRGSLKNKVAVNKFLSIISFIKQERPYVKVGIYGLPFKGYYSSQLKANENQKLDPVLRSADILFPSLYIGYPAKQVGTTFNLNFLKRNLDIALEYGKRLDKPVLPFVWYLIHPTNKKYGLNFIPKEEMIQYLNFIFSYTNDEKNKVSGVVWWDTPTQYKGNQLKNELLNGDYKKNKWTLDTEFEFYFNSFFKSLK